MPGTPQRARVSGALGGVQPNGAVAGPGEQPIGLVLGFLMPPGDLQHLIGACVVAHR